MNDFILNYYFALYKNAPLPNRDKFRMKFRTKHGKYLCLEELIVMIERYQLKKYRCTLWNTIDRIPKNEMLRTKKKDYEYRRKNGIKYI